MLYFSLESYSSEPSHSGINSNTLSIVIHKPVQTYFNKILPSGKLADGSHPSYRIKFTKVTDISATSSIKLLVTPNLINNGDKVNVSWYGNIKHSHDWIALYCPSNADANKYLDYWEIDDYKSNGATFQLYNIRCECEFRYYRNRTDDIMFLARSDLITFKGGKLAPVHGHLALTLNPSEMRVQWTSGTNAKPIVLYGTSSDNLNMKSEGHWTTYKASDMCADPANLDINFIDPGYLHDVLLTDLKPRTTYFYKFGSSELLSDIFQFTSAPDVGDQRSFKFVTYGDMGVPLPSNIAIPSTADLVKQEIDKGTELVIHQGDLSYAVGYAHVWEQWMYSIERISTAIPYMVGIGNHEQGYLWGNGQNDPSGGDKGNGYHPSWGNYGHDSGGECGVPTVHRFHMPDNGNKVWWYSFDYGLVHFTMMSTEHNFSRESVQYKWLEKDLSSVDRRKTPWLIVVGHRPMYNSEKYFMDHQVAIHMQKFFEPLLQKYKVDIAFWGHFHSYERTCKVYRSKCVKDGIVHITIGSAGAELDSVGLYEVEWSEHFELSYGYGRVTVANSSALLCEFLRSKDGVVSDSSWIIK